MTSSYMFLQVSLSGHNGLVPQTVRKRAIPPYWCFWRVFSQAWGKISVRIQWDTTQHERGRKLSHIFNLRDRSETSQARRPLYAHGGQIPNTEVKLWLPEAGTRVFIIVYHVTFESWKRVARLVVLIYPTMGIYFTLLSWTPKIAKTVNFSYLYFTINKHT